MCFDFLSFAQFEKNEQAAKRDCYHGFADAFFFLDDFTVVIIILSVQNFFFPCFC